MEPSGPELRRGLAWLRPRRAGLVAVALLALVALAAAVLLPTARSGPVNQDAGAPEPGVLVIESTPAGAQVLLDDEATGATPLRLEALTPGRHTLRVSLTGYRDWQETIDIAAGDSARRVVQLEPLPASLEVTASAPGARVSLDGASRGTAPLVVPAVSPGAHSLRLELDGYRVWEGALWVGPGERKVVRADLARDGPTEHQPPPPERALAIMVENSPQARPQSGLDRADVVFEAMAEGGISRFLALYLVGEAEVVGPVRSTRHYFVSWASEFDAALIHIGASPQGYAALRTAGIATLDETRGDPGFWRIRQRFAPHNAYTSTAAARSALAQDGPGGGWAGLTFKEPTWLYPGEAVEHLVLDYGWGYSVSYTFDPRRHQYRRDMAGAPHRDAETGRQLTAASVVVMRVPAHVIDGQGRLDMAIVGSGRADYFLDGVHLEGSWQRGSLAEPTHFLDGEGAPVYFNPGPLWIQVAPPEARLVF